MVNTVMQWRLSSAILLKATIVTKCLNQITWGHVNELEDKPNGQKYLAAIVDFHIGPSLNQFMVNGGNIILLDTSTSVNNGQPMANKRTKRGLYRYIENLWKDFKHMLTPDPKQPMARDDFDLDMIESLENEIEKTRKCHYEIPNKYWEDSLTNKFYLYYGKERSGVGASCINCQPMQPVNPLAKMSLPFWFIQLDDGSIPQIRFSKQDTNNEVKNWKKYLASLFSIQLNINKNEEVTIWEKTWLGNHQSNYHLLNATSKINGNENIQLNISNPIQINKHIRHIELNVDPIQQQEQVQQRRRQLKNRLFEEFNQPYPSVAIAFNQTFTVDKYQSIIINSGK